MASARYVELGSKDVLIFKGMEIDQDVLEAIVETNKRLLWAFVRGERNDIRAVPYSEDRVIWLAEEDLRKEQDVEI